MNRTSMGLTAGLLALAMVGCGTTSSMVAGVPVALAQERSSAMSIAVVDVEFLLQNSDAANRVSAQIEKARADHRREVKSKLEDIDKLGESIGEERPTLSQDTYRQRMRDLRQKAAIYQSDMQERQGKLDDAAREASQKIAAAITQIVDELVKERKLTLVLPRSAIIGTATVPDITQDVLKRLNQRTPSVSINLPK